MSILRSRAQTSALMLCCALIAWTVGSDLAGRGPSPADAVTWEAIEPVAMSIGDDALLGTATAHVALIEFADFECPFCSAFAQDVLPVLKRDYIDTGRVSFVFRHLPLSSHKYALRAAMLAECGRQQGTFWDVYSALFSRRGFLDESALSAMDASIRSAGDRCDATRASRAVDVDIQLARRLGISDAPTFVVGKLDGGTVRAAARLVGMAEVGEFAREFEQLLKQK